MNPIDNLVSAIREKLLRAISDYGMINPGERVLIAVSGGKDSFTLLHQLGALKDEVFPEVEFSALKIKTDIT